jgi:hypothetical protein
MQSYETSATVEGEGQVRLVGVPFPPGTPVEVTINPQRRSPAEFAVAWKRLCDELRAVHGTAELNEADIEREIDDYQAGR